MASKTYHVGLSGTIHRLDNLNFDPGGNTYTNWVNLTPNLLSSLNLPSQAREFLRDVMTIPGNKDKVFIVGTVQSLTGAFRGIVYSTNAGTTFITPGFPGGSVTNHINNWWVLTNNELPFNYYEVWCTDANTVYACGDDAAIIRSLDGGSTFILKDIPHALFGQSAGTLRPSATSIHFDTPNDGVVGTSSIGGLPYVFTTTTGSGACTWLPTAAVPAQTGTLKGIYKKEKLIVAVGSAKIICSLDGGSTWSTQYTWSELGNFPYEKNGEHLTWYYESCNQILYFRATGRRNEIVQAAYKFGSVNSFINISTGFPVSIASAWSIFNSHVYDVTPPSTSNPSEDYYAAHFFKPFEGFLGRTEVDINSSGALGYRRVDWYLNNSEIPNVDQVPPQAKDERLMAIWTEIDPVVYYSIQKCGTEEILYFPVGTDTANVSSLVGETVSNVIIDGEVDSSCWTVDGPITCSQEILSDVNTLSVVTRNGCTDPFCVDCYKLIACQPEIGQDGQSYFPSVIVYSNTPGFDLEDYLFQVFTFNNDIQGICPGKCFYLTKSSSCNTPPVAFPTSYSIYDNCEDCIPQCPVELNTRSVKPGFYTPGCPPDYTVKTSCMYAEQVYDEMVAIRYGITICCDHDIDRWDIKKQLLDLKALYDECLCVSAICPVCVEPCNLEVNLSIYIPVTLDPPVDPCNPPSGPIVIDLGTVGLCYFFPLKDNAPIAFSYLESVTLGGVTYDLTSVLTTPLNSPLFSSAFIAAVQTIGVTSTGTFLGSVGEVAEGLYIYGFTGNLTQITIVDVYDLTTVTSVIVATEIPCEPSPDVECYAAPYLLGSAVPGVLNTITIYDGTASIVYNIAPLAISTTFTGLVPSLVTYLQSQGYDCDCAVIQIAGPFSYVLTLKNFTGGVPVALYPQFPGLPLPPVPNEGYYFKTNTVCGDIGC